MIYFSLFFIRLFLFHDLEHWFNRLNLINSNYIFFVFFKFQILLIIRFYNYSQLTFYKIIVT